MKELDPSHLPVRLGRPVGRFGGSASWACQRACTSYARRLADQTVARLVRGERGAEGSPAAALKTRSRRVVWGGRVAVSPCVMASPRRQDIEGALEKYRAAAMSARASIGAPAGHSSASHWPRTQPPVLPQGLPVADSFFQTQELPQPEQMPARQPQRDAQTPAVQLPTARMPTVNKTSADTLEQRLARLEQLYEQERTCRIQLQKQLAETEEKGEETDESIDQLVQLASELHARQTEHGQRVAKLEGTASDANMQNQFAEQLESKFAEERDVYIKLLEASSEDVVSEVTQTVEGLASSLQSVHSQVLALQAVRGGENTGGRDSAQQNAALVMRVEQSEELTRATMSRAQKSE